MTTKNLIPRGSGEGGIGITGTSWGSGVFNTGFFDSVGIGTYSPTHHLHLFGDSQVKLKVESTAGNPEIQFTQPDVNDNTTTSSWMVGQSSNDFFITKHGFGAGHQFVINNDGNVGIGTMEPASILELANDTSPEIIFNDSTAGDRGSIDFQDGDFRFWSDYTDPGVVAGVATNNFTISKSGDVGIGTLTPGHNLHISGSNPGAKLEGTQPRIWLKENDQADLNTLVRLRNSVFRIDTVDDNDQFQDNRLTILNTNGNVGIGTTTPAHKLEVNSGALCVQSSGPMLILKDEDGGDVNSQNGYVSFRDNSDTERGYVGFGSVVNKNLTVSNNIGDIILHGGDVGIGTSTPGSKLEISEDPISDSTDLSPKKVLSLTRPDVAGTTYAQRANFFLRRYEGQATAGINTQSRTQLDIALAHSAGEYGELSNVDGTNERDGGTSVLKLRSDGLVETSGPLHISGVSMIPDEEGRINFGPSGIMVGQAEVRPDPDNPESIYFQAIPQVKDSEGNAVTVLTADKLGLGTTAVLESAEQDLQFKLLTDQQRFVVGTTGDYGLESGWYRFNDFKVKGATDVGAHPINPVDTRIYADDSSFVLFKTDTAGNRVAHLVGGDEEVSPNNAIALGIAVKVDSTEAPQDIEFVHTDGESYSVINGNSDSLGTNGLPIRQGFQSPSVGSNPAPLLIDGGSF